MDEKQYILVVAYAIYPEIKSSEGIVNANWIKTIENDSSVLHISLISTISQVTNNWSSSPLKKLENIYADAKNRSSFGGILQRIKNKLFKNEYGFPYSVVAWKNIQLPRLVSFLTSENNIVVWARVLPSHTLALLLEAYKVVPFPIVLNINDPIEKELKNEYAVFERLKDSIQCFTFPSKALAHEMAEAHKLDKSRCFVLPHAMEKQDVLYRDTPRDTLSKVKIVYTGTFYKSAFTKEFQEGLKKFMNTPAAKNVSFTFILSQFDEASIDWLKAAIPAVEILTKVDRSKVLSVLSNADIVTVVDAVTHKNLLKGKLAEAISFGVPILGISYENSVIDKVLREYGTPCAYQDVSNDVFEKLQQLVENVVDEDWVLQFKNQRKKVMKDFSAKIIAEKTVQINEFAQLCFEAKNANKGDIEPLLLHNWP